MPRKALAAAGRAAEGLDELWSGTGRCEDFRRRHDLSRPDRPSGTSGHPVARSVSARRPLAVDDAEEIGGPPARPAESRARQPLPIP
jgi:hypothetical protein